MPSKASLSSTAPARGARGVRILALDGGGTRALLTIEMLKELERRAGRPVHELFDLVAGTSTGAILAAGIQARIPLDELEQLYLALAAQVFVDDGRFTKMARQLVTGAAYKAARLEAILAELLPSPVPDEGMRARWSRLAREPADDRAALPPPHLMIAACLVSRAPPVPFVFRDYEVSDEDDAEPVRRPAGTSAVPVQQALRATSAAPSYFPELVLSSLAANGEEAVPQEQQPPRQPPQPQPQQQRAPPPRAPPAVFQDGGLVANNPAALALREVWSRAPKLAALEPSDPPSLSAAGARALPGRAHRRARLLRHGRLCAVGRLSAGLVGGAGADPGARGDTDGGGAPAAERPAATHGDRVLPLQPGGARLPSQRDGAVAAARAAGHRPRRRALRGRRARAGEARRTAHAASRRECASGRERRGGRPAVGDVGVAGGGARAAARARWRRRGGAPEPAVIS